MTRDHDALAVFLDARRTRPFEWGRGKNDCISFAFAAVTAQGLPDPMRFFSNRWSSARGASRALAAHGGLEAVMAIAFRRIPPAMARRGDLALARTAEGRPVILVVEGETLCGPGPSGLTRAPRAAAEAAWSAG